MPIITIITGPEPRGFEEIGGVRWVNFRGGGGGSFINMNLTGFAL